VIFQLRNSVSQGRQKTYLFECLDLDELASLIECYSPGHVTWASTNGSAAHRPTWRYSQVIGRLAIGPLASILCPNFISSFVFKKFTAVLIFCLVSLYLTVAFSMT